MQLSLVYVHELRFIVGINDVRLIRQVRGYLHITKSKLYFNRSNLN